MSAEPTNNRFVAYLEDYAGYHRTPGNKRTHLVGIPMLTVTIVGLLAHVSFGPSLADGLVRLDLGILFWAAVTVWYLSMDVKIALPSSAIGLVMYAIGRALPLSVLGVLFVVGWVIQYVGHIRYEKNSPAFYKNFEHLLIGPVWVFGNLFGYLPPLQPAKPRPADTLRAG